MRLSRTQVVASVFCLLVPLSLAAQGNPNDPTNPITPSSPAANPSPTSGQTTPGVARPNTGQSSSFNSESTPGGADSDAQMMKDKMFLKEASQGGMSEVQMGQLASERGSNPKVKAYGQKMVTDHTMLNNELKPFADKMGVPPPAGLSSEDQAELDKLNGLSGAEFDKEYVSYMMKDHAKDLKDFSKEASSAGDPDLKAAVMKGEKVIAQHKRMIDKIGASMSVTASM